MTQDEYQENFCCDCPRCGELPQFRSNGKGQWAVCKPCNIRWLIGIDVLENCMGDAQNTLEGLTQELVA